MTIFRGFAVFLLLAVVVGLEACGGEDREATTIPAAATPQELAASAGFDGVESGELEIALEIDRYRKPQPEEINMRILGNFMGAGDEDLPEFDFGIESHGPLAGHEVDFNSGFVLLPQRAVVSYGPTEGELVYQPDKATFEELKSDFEDAQGEGGAGDVGACLEAAGDLSLADVLSHVSLEGKSETLDGEPIEVVGGELDVPAAIDELVRMSEDEGCEAQLEAVGVSVAELKVLENQLKKSLISAPVTIGIDKHGVFRSLKVLVNVELPSNEELEVELVMRLNKVNEVTELPQPVGVTPFEALLKKFGVDLQKVKEADSGERLTSFLEAVRLGLFERGSP